MPGLLQLYIGDGKGKTTASVGLCVRAAGSGRRVTFAQFLKSRPSGELAMLEKLGVTVLRSEEKFGFTFTMTEAQRTACAKAQEALLTAAAAALSPEPALLVLDEALDALELGMINCLTLKSLIEKRPPETEIVLTGRRAPQWLMDGADYISQVVKIKHPFDKKVPAREGIEY
jgi:cob(I)alamin adenosyltransferase